MLQMSTRRTLRQKLSTRYRAKAYRNKNGEDAIPPPIDDAERTNSIQARNQPPDDDDASPSQNDDGTRTQGVQKANHTRRHPDIRNGPEEQENTCQITE